MRDEHAFEVTSLDEPFLCAPFESVFRTADAPLAVGQRFRGRVFAVEVLAADERGATRLRLEFGEPLASPRLRFLTWRDGAYRALALPPPGGTLELLACEPIDPLLP